MRLICNGVALDLEAGATMSFKKLNPLFAFDKLTCERTQSFNLPATPTNDRVLELAKIPAYYGAGMRRRFDAELQDGTVVKQGYLYVDKYASGKYSAVFVTGELLGLLKIKQAGKLADLYQPVSTTFWGDGTRVKEASSMLQNDGILINRYKYRSDIQEKYTGVSYALGKISGYIATSLGVRIKWPSSYYKYWCLLGTMKPAKEVAGHFKSEIRSGSTTVNNLNEEDMGYLVLTDTRKVEYTKTNPYEILSTMYVTEYVAQAAIRITFPDNLPDDYFLVDLPTNGSNDLPGELPETGGRFYGDYSFDVDRTGTSSQTIYYISGEPLAGRTVEIPRGGKFILMRRQDYWYQGTNTKYIGYRFAYNPSGLVYDFLVTIKSASSDITYGDVVRLVDNMPDITLVDAIKVIASLEGRVLNYTDADGLTFEALDDIDTWPTVEIRHPLGTDEVARKFSDYGQHNIVLFDSNDYVRDSSKIRTDYAIDNDNLDAERELQKIPFSEGDFLDIDTYIFSQLDIDEERGTTVLTTGARDTIIKLGSGTGDYADRVTVPTIPGLQALCQASTAITLRARMTLQEYDALAAKVTILYAGTLYVWTEANWSDNVATIKLSKI